MLLQSLIRTIPDFPKPGIQYRDITSLIRDPRGLKEAVDGIAARYRQDSIELVVGIEARGFLFGSAVAYQLGCGFVPIRKKGKLPRKTINRSFNLEYGQDRIELHAEDVPPNVRVLLVDDLVATGGTAAAAIELLRQVGATVVECAFVVALPDLGGIARIEQLGCRVHRLCDFSGD